MKWYECRTTLVVLYETSHRLIKIRIPVAHASEMAVALYVAGLHTQPSACGLTSSVFSHAVHVRTPRSTPHTHVSTSARLGDMRSSNFRI